MAIRRPELSSRVFRKFKETVLGIPKIEKTSLEELIIKQNNIAVFFSAMIIMACDIFWAIAMNFRDFGIKTPLGITAIIIQFTFAAGMFVCSILSNKIKMSLNLRRILLILYHLSIIVTSTMIVIGNDIFLARIGVESSEGVGIALVSLFFLIIVLTPTPYLIDSIFINVCMFASCFLPLAFKASEVYPLVYHIVFTVCMIAAYAMYSFFLRTLAEKQMKIRELNNDLVVKSYVDSLTSALNRRALDSYLSYIRNSDYIKNMGALLFDIDDFKSYNDHYTHYDGDIALKKVCESIANEAEGIYLFRYGGEEFMLFLENPTEKDVINFAKKINMAVYKANIERNDVPNYNRITISVGACILNINEIQIQDYNKRADKQLSICKNNGKNCVAINDEMYHNTFENIETK